MTGTDPTSRSGLGAGISYRPQYLQPLLAGELAVTHVELPIEQAVLDERITARVQDIAARYPVVLHGVSQSLGTRHAVSRSASIRATQLLANLLRPVWTSDHIAATAGQRLNTRTLLAVPRTEANARLLAANARAYAAHADLPVVLECIAQIADPGGDLTEGAFIRRVLELSGCGLLLDLHNVYATAVNQGVDPGELLESLPVERTVQVHLAGGQWSRGHYHDTHAQAVPEPVWDLLSQLLSVLDWAPAITLERDDPDAPLGEVTHDLDRLRGVLGSVSPWAISDPSPSRDFAPPSAPAVPESGGADDLVELEIDSVLRRTARDLRWVFRSSWPHLETVVHQELEQICRRTGHLIHPVECASAALELIELPRDVRDRGEIDIAIHRSQQTLRPGESTSFRFGSRIVHIHMNSRYATRVRETLEGRRDITA